MVSLAPGGLRIAAMVGAGMLAPGATVAQAPDRLPGGARVTARELVAFDGRRQDAELIELAVLHPAPGGRDSVRIELSYFRLPARTRTGGSPIVFLMGGPGVPASLIGRIPPYWSLFERLRSAADVILLDQRGVGMSRPAADCPGGPPPPVDFLTSGETLREALRATYAECVATWRRRGVPAELLSVPEVARDVDDIRRQLGVARVSLLGFSYGTRLALEYVRRFPEQVDRVALQGVLGLDDGIRLPAELDSVLARVAALAARDSVARQLAPDLEAGVAEIIRQAGRSPFVVPAPTASGDTVQLTVGAGGLRAIVSGRLGDPRLPALVGSLRAGDLRLLAQFASGIYRDLAAGGGPVFGRAVYCSAPGSRERELAARAQAGTALIGEVFDNVVSTPEFCHGIGIAPGPPPEAAPPPLNRPALLITGVLDDRTPPSNAERARRYFRDPVVVTVEGGGHDLLPAAAVARLVVDFFTGGPPPGPLRLSVAPPRFLTLDEALRPPARR